MVHSQAADGALLRIGAVARQAGVSIGTVRCCERRGLLAPAGRLGSGYRLCTPAVAGAIALARRLQGLGMTLDEVAGALTAHDRADVTCESGRWRLEAVLDRTRARLAELTDLQNRLQGVLGACAAGHCELRPAPSRPDGAPRPPSPMTLAPQASASAADSERTGAAITTAAMQAAFPRKRIVHDLQAVSAETRSHAVVRAAFRCQARSMPTLP